MSAKQTIVINGTVYDAISGLRVGGVLPVTPKKVESAPISVPKKVLPAHTPAGASHAIHQAVKKSTTLRRSHLAHPQNKVRPVAVNPHANAYVERSPMVAHFAAHPQPITKSARTTFISDIGPGQPVQKVIVPQPKQKTSSTELKEQLLARASHTVDMQKAVKKAHVKPTRAKRTLKLRHTIATCVALLLIGGYFSYLNMPGLSVRLAASQAGVAATYPDYNPDGYSFDGPVAFEQGRVELRFKSNGGSAGYTINQRASNWNSVAVLDNLVAKASSGEYDTVSEGGVIIYTYGNNAAWSNGGILYTVEGNAPLSSEQLVRIASSM